jgi:ribonuclease BN (tRNA processing enzyme)
MTVLGGCGAWPTATQACSGYLVEHEGYTVLIDPGYATFPRLLAHLPAERLDAVLVSHGHPDHCADLNPLLRARALGDTEPPALPVYALPGALDAVLALDSPRMLADAVRVREFMAGDRFELGPFLVDTVALPHFVPNAGTRLSADGTSLAYTGDTGPSEDIVALARNADVFLAEATFPDRIRPAGNAPFLCTAQQAGSYTSRAGAGRLLLTHLWPGTDPDLAIEAAGFPAEVARQDLVVDL